MHTDQLIDYTRLVSIIKNTNKTRLSTAELVEYLKALAAKCEDLQQEVNDLKESIKEIKT